MEKIDTRQYPYDLLSIVFAPEPIPASVLANKDLPLAVEYVLSQLDPGSAKVLRCWAQLRACNSPKKNCDNLSAEMTDAIVANALREVRKPSRLRYILYGFAMCEQMRVEEARVKAYELGYQDGVGTKSTNTPQNVALDDMELTTGIRNQLAAAYSRHKDDAERYRIPKQITCSDDIAALTAPQFYHIRNLGTSKQAKILTKLDELGYDTTKFRKYPK